MISLKKVVLLSDLDSLTANWKRTNADNVQNNDSDRRSSVFEGVGLERDVGK